VILAAATELFAARGYANVTVPEVAARSRVGLGTLYLRYPSKEALGNAVFRHCKLTWKEAVLDPWTTKGDAKAQLRDYWARLTRFVEKHPDAARYLETTPLGHPLDPDSQALRDELGRRSAEHVGAWIASGEVRPRPIEVVAALVHGTFWHIFLDAPSDRRRALLSAGREAVWCALASPATGDGEETVKPGKRKRGR
jgi:TetR/AcrR family transcriptional regulator, repressor of fatR-cypB operon